jgi:hypothetical protein
MRHLPNLVGVAVLVGGVFAIAPAAWADASRSKSICKSVDEGAPERIGDREGHMMAIYDVTCSVVEGQPTGGVSTGKVIVEWDKTHATLIAGGGVMRSPGSVFVFENTQEDGDLTVADGKIIGYASAGRGKIIWATGAAATSVGKSYSYTTKSTGPGQSVVESLGD